MKNVFKMLEAALGRTPTAAEVQAAQQVEQDVSASGTVLEANPVASDPVNPNPNPNPTVTAPVSDSGLSASEREELENLRAEQSRNMQRQRELLVSQASERGKKQANDLLASNKILPHQVDAYAAAFGKVAELQAKYSETSIFHFSVVSEDGATVTEKSANLFDFFAKAIEGTEANGLDKEKVKDAANLGAVFNRAKSEPAKAEDGSDNTPVPQSRIDNVVALATGKRVAVGDYNKEAVNN